jgi:protein arginine N-methyltransferase 3
MRPSLHLPHPSDIPSKEEDTESDSGSSVLDDDDQDWDDWVSDSFAKQPCKSLFDEKTFPSVKDALLHDRSDHGFNLSDFCSRLCLYFFSIGADRFD